MPFLTGCIGLDPARLKDFFRALIFGTAGASSFKEVNGSQWF